MIFTSRQVSTNLYLNKTGASAPPIPVNCVPKGSNYCSILKRDESQGKKCNKSVYAKREIGRTNFIAKLPSLSAIIKLKKRRMVKIANK